MSRHRATPPPPTPGEYMRSALHLERVETASGLIVERLKAISNSGAMAVISEIVGISLGIARFQQLIPVRHAAARPGPAKDEPRPPLGRRIVNVTAALMGDPAPGRRLQSSQDRERVAARPARQTPTKLGPSQTAVLQALLDGGVKSKEQIAARASFSASSVPVFISVIRQKLGKDAIRTVPGGFELASEMTDKARAILGSQAKAVADADPPVRGEAETAGGVAAAR